MNIKGILLVGVLIATTQFAVQDAKAVPNPAWGAYSARRGYTGGPGAIMQGDTPQDYGQGGDEQMDNGETKDKEVGLDELQPGTVWADAPNKVPASSVKYKMPPGIAKLISRVSSPRNGELTTVSSSQADAIEAAIVGAAVANDPEGQLHAAKANQQAQASEAGNAAADVEKNQSASAIDFCASFLKNFTVEKGNKWNQLRDNLFVPMGILLLLPGALLTQMRAIVAAGSPVLGDANPWEGIQRSIVAVFLIPGTYLVVNYAIDLSNSITFTINDEYTRLFGSDMYRDAICAQIRAFPARQPSENRNALDLKPPQMGPLLNKGGGAFAQFEGNMLEGKIEDPCLGIYMAPKDRADEALTSGSVAARLGLNASNAMLAASWNILCAFQMAYFYYLWFVGPVVAGLWVWPMKQLRSALPSWVEGVVTLGFWALFWNTTILLMACFKGVDETGTIIMSALNFLATSSVKFAFDFAGLVKAAGQEAASMAEKAMKGGAAGGGGGHGGSHGGSHAGASGRHGGAAAASRGSHGKQLTADNHAGEPKSGAGKDVALASARSFDNDHPVKPTQVSDNEGFDKPGKGLIELASFSPSGIRDSREHFKPESLPPSEKFNSAVGHADPNAPRSNNDVMRSIDMPPSANDHGLVWNASYSSDNNTHVGGDSSQFHNSSSSQFDSLVDGSTFNANIDSKSINDMMNDSSTNNAWSVDGDDSIFNNTAWSVDGDDSIFNNAALLNGDTNTNMSFAPDDVKNFNGFDQSSVLNAAFNNSSDSKFDSSTNNFADNSVVLGGAREAAMAAHQEQAAALARQQMEQHQQQQQHYAQEHNNHFGDANVMQASFHAEQQQVNREHAMRAAFGDIVNTAEHAHGPVNVDASQMNVANNNSSFSSEALSRSAADQNVLNDYSALNNSSSVVDASMSNAFIDASNNPALVDASLSSSIIDASLNSNMVDSSLNSSLVDASMNSSLNNSVVDASFNSSILDASSSNNVMFKDGTDITNGDINNSNAVYGDVNSSNVYGDFSNLVNMNDSSRAVVPDNNISSQAVQPNNVDNSFFSANNDSISLSSMVDGPSSLFRSSVDGDTNVVNANASVDASQYSATHNLNASMDASQYSSLQNVNASMDASQYNSTNNMNASVDAAQYSSTQSVNSAADQQYYTAASNVDQQINNSSVDQQYFAQPVKGAENAWQSMALPGLEQVAFTNGAGPVERFAPAVDASSVSNTNASYDVANNAQYANASYDVANNAQYANASYDVAHNAQYANASYDVSSSNVSNASYDVANNAAVTNASYDVANNAQYASASYDSSNTVSNAASYDVSNNAAVTNASYDVANNASYSNETRSISADAQGVVAQSSTSALAAVAFASEPQYMAANAQGADQNFTSINDMQYASGQASADLGAISNPRYVADQASNDLYQAVTNQQQYAGAPVPGDVLVGSSQSYAAPQQSGDVCVVGGPSQSLAAQAISESIRGAVEPQFVAAQAADVVRAGEIVPSDVVRSFHSESQPLLAQPAQTALAALAFASEPQYVSAQPPVSSDIYSAAQASADMGAINNPHYVSNQAAAELNHAVSYEGAQYASSSADVTSHQYAAASADVSNQYVASCGDVSNQYAAASSADVSNQYVAASSADVSNQYVAASSADVSNQYVAASAGEVVSNQYAAADNSSAHYAHSVSEYAAPRHEQSYAAVDASVDQYSSIHAPEYSANHGVSYTPTTVEYNHTPPTTGSGNTNVYPHLSMVDTDVAETAQIIAASACFSKATVDAASVSAKLDGSHTMKQANNLLGKMSQIVSNIDHSRIANNNNFTTNEVAPKTDTTDSAREARKTLSDLVPVMNDVQKQQQSKENQASGQKVQRLETSQAWFETNLQPSQTRVPVMASAKQLRTQEVQAPMNGENPVAASGLAPAIGRVSRLNSALRRAATTTPIEPPPMHEPIETVIEI